MKYLRIFLGECDQLAAGGLAVLVVVPVLALVLVLPAAGAVVVVPVLAGAALSVFAGASAPSAAAAGVLVPPLKSVAYQPLPFN